MANMICDRTQSSNYGNSQVVPQKKRLIHVTHLLMILETARTEHNPCIWGDKPGSEAIMIYVDMVHSQLLPYPSTLSILFLTF